MDTDQDSPTVERVASGLAPEGPVNPAEVLDMMEGALYQSTDRLNARVTQVAGESLIGIMEKLDNHHNMEFVRGSLRRATRFMLTSMNDKDV